MTTLYAYNICVSLSTQQVQAGHPEQAGECDSKRFHREEQWVQSKQYGSLVWLLWEVEYVI